MALHRGVTSTAVKRALVGFWAVWSTLVFASNAGDALRALGVLSPSFPFASGNLAAVASVVQRMGIPMAGAALLFACVLAWDGLNTILFWRAVRHDARSASYDHVPATRAFAVSLGLWGALMIADELFLAFEVGSFEQTHRGIFTAMLVSYLVVRLVPDD